MKKQIEETLLTQTNLYSEAKRRYDELNKIKIQKEKALINYPDGKLHLVNRHGNATYYLRTDPSDRSGIYIPKTDIKKIRNYAQKSYDEKILKIINSELCNLDSFLRKANYCSCPKSSFNSNNNTKVTTKSESSAKSVSTTKSTTKSESSIKHNPNIGLYSNIGLKHRVNAVMNPNISDSSNTYLTQIQQVYSNSHPDFKSLVIPIDMSDDDYVSKWLSEEYIGKEISDSVPFYETDLKERVRSKSELTIANSLFKYGIPYRYECPLTLQNGYIIHPDFTVLNVRKRQVFYWEHRGMMDDPDYATHTVFRMKSYMNEGIILGKNLIITEETSANPLGTNEIETIIKTFLCD